LIVRSSQKSWLILAPHRKLVLEGPEESFNNGMRGSCA
jgi:hypothetical protein